MHVITHAIEKMHNSIATNLSAKQLHKDVKFLG